MKHIIAGEECDKCTHCTFFEDDRNILKVYCNKKDKEYYYGASIPCEDFENANED